MAILFRLLSGLALIAAIVAGTVDAIRSVAETAVVVTPLGIAVASVSASWLEALERPGGDFAMLQPVVRWCLQQPAFAVFLSLALLFWMAGYRRTRKPRLA